MSKKREIRIRIPEELGLSSDDVEQISGALAESVIDVAKGARATSLSAVEKSKVKEVEEVAKEKELPVGKQKVQNISKK